MPFRSMFSDSALSAEDLNVLQDAYEAAAADFVDIDELDRQTAVQVLLMCYRAGERDRNKLISHARKALGRPFG